MRTSTSRETTRPVAARIAASSSAVFSLLSRGGPPDITRLVIPIVVRKAVDTMKGGWSSADLFQKRGEIMLPFITHADATPTIEQPVFRVRVGTAMLDPRPGGILGCFFRFSMYGAFMGSLFRQAAAGSRGAST